MQIILHNMPPKTKTKKQRREEDKRSMIEIDPEGDLILKVGTDDKQQSIRVSRSVLKLASPVFKAMLGPNFAESDATVVDLPDDDPQAMRDLCKVVHLRTSELNMRDRSWVLGLAVVCDKYQCTQQCRHVFDLVLGNYSSDSLTGESWSDTVSSYTKLSLTDVVGIAYVLNDSKLFWKATRDAMSTVSAYELAKAPETDILEMLPTCLMGKKSSELTQS